MVVSFRPSLESCSANPGFFRDTFFVSLAKGKHRMIERQLYMTWGWSTMILCPRGMNKEGICRKQENRFLRCKRSPVAHFQELEGGLGLWLNLKDSCIDQCSDNNGGVLLYSNWKTSGNPLLCIRQAIRGCDCSWLRTILPLLLHTRRQLQSELHKTCNLQWFHIRSQWVFSECRCARRGCCSRKCWSSIALSERKKSS